MDKETNLQTDFDTLFKQLFCVTAQELSDELRQPLQDLGILYDDVLATNIPISRLSQAMGRSSLRTGKGQMMFTVRQLQRNEAARLASLGFRFAAIDFVTPAVSRRTHVPEATLLERLRDMRDYACSNRSFAEGVHLVSFVMRPTVADHFEVLTTTKGISNPLPSSTLPMKRLLIQHFNLISHMEGWSMTRCLKYLRSDPARQMYNAMDDFREHLIQGITSLSKTLPEELRPLAQFSPRPLQAPCRSSHFLSEKDEGPRQCTLLTFCVAGTLDLQIPNSGYAFTPFRLFRVQQQVNDTELDGDSFSREIGQDLFCTDVRFTTPNSDSGTISSTRSAFQRLWPSPKQPVASECRSTESLATHATTALGNITVQREVRVDVTRLPEDALPDGKGRHTMIAANGVAVTPATYVDELYSLCFAPGLRQLLQTPSRMFEV